MDRNRIGPWVALMVLTAGVVGTWVYWWNGGAARVATGLKSSGVLADLGAGGDSFGGFSALMSALAFIGLGLTAFLQYEQLKHAREQANATVAQFSRQSFEALFFQLISLLRAHTDATVLSESSITEQAGSFHAELAKFRQHASESWDAKGDPPATPDVLIRVGLDPVYEHLYWRNESSLGPFFRTLYHALELVYHAQLPETEKVQYANSLRGLLSADELLAVMLRCRSVLGGGLKFYVEHFGLLKHVSVRYQMDSEIARHSFRPSAWLSYAERKDYWLKEPEARPAPTEDA